MRAANRRETGEREEEEGPATVRREQGETGEQEGVTPSPPRNDNVPRASRLGGR